MQAALQHALAGRSARIISLLSDWDDSGTGVASRRDMRRALALLGLKADRADFDAVFNTLSGSKYADKLVLTELRRKLHAGLDHPPRRRGGGQ